MLGEREDAETPVVLHLVYELNYGGLESRMVNLGRFSQSSNFRHVFCSITGGGHAEASLRGMDIEVKLLGARGRLISIGAMLRFAYLIGEVRPMVVHSHGAEGNLYGMLVATLCRVPVRISEEIGIPNHSKLGRLLFQFVHRLANNVVAVSHSTKNALVDAQEVKENHCRVIESPANLPPRRTLENTRESPRTLAFLGRLEPVKNPLALLEAVRILKSEGTFLRLVVIGDGSLRSQMEKSILEWGIGADVVMRGYEKEPFEFLQEASLFVQPSVSEGMSMALVEAMSAGIPPLVSPFGGGREIVESNVTGWFFSNLEPRGIAAGISDVITRPISELNQVGKAASDFVSQRFSPRRYVRELDEYYLANLERRTR